MDSSGAHLPALKLLACHRPLVIAHRGYSQFAPENTLFSFKLALDAGADLVELDYRHSQDGQLIVMHDSELDRTTDAATQWPGKHFKVESKTAAEIQGLDAGSWFDGRLAGARVPLLSEALDVIQERGVALVERKAGPPAACIRLLREKKLINRVVVQSFDWQYLRSFHEQEPRQALGALGPPALLSNGKRPPPIFRRFHPRWLDELLRTGAKVAVWSQRVTLPAIRLAHERGLKVWVYTVNAARPANRLLDLGVDGLITNNPALIWRTIARRCPVPSSRL